MPKLHKKLKDLDIFRDKAELKWKYEKENDKKKQEEEDMGGAASKHALNSLKSDLDHLKGVWSMNRKEEMDGMVGKLKNAEYEIELMKMDVETYAKKTDIDRISSKFFEYAPISAFRELQEDLEECAKKGEFTGVYMEVTTLKKDVANYMLKDEITARISSIYKDLLA